jgi:glyoxylase-like metal-dependent hydrolase (beta-lactamase superfamily II)
VIIEKFVVGALETNCYVVADEETKEAAVIDPGAAPAAIKNFIKKNHLTVKYVINTHGHGDHIAANVHFAEKGSVDLLIHELDADLLGKPALNLSAAFGADIRSPAATQYLKDGDEIALGRLCLKVLHTPGHTPGGISLVCGTAVFTGDTLFYEGIGRTDLAGSSERAIQESVKDKLLALPDNYTVYPGHGPETTIGHERRHNPFI